MTDRTNADFFQVLLRQARQDPLVYLVFAECGLVPFEAEAPQPSTEVHDGAPPPPWSIASLEGPGEVLGGVGGQRERAREREAVTGDAKAVKLSLIVPRIVMLVVPKTSTTVWVLILLFGTPTATTALLLPTLAALLTTLVLTTLGTLPALLAALILTLILRHHYLPSFGSRSH